MVMMVIMMVMMPVILADAPDVMMMPRLRLANGCLKSRQLHPILAQLAIHVRLAMDCFVRSLRENLNQ